MNNNGDLQLRDPKIIPTSELLEQVLGNSYAIYETFQDTILQLEIEQEWQWYTPHKAWFARGQHFWTTPREAKKEKTLYWLYVYEGSFSVAIWFKEKNRTEALKTNLSEKTKQLICDAKSYGKVATFPVKFDVTASEQLTDIYALIECKKRLEK